MDTKHTKGPWVVYADLPSIEPDWHIVTNESRLRVLANVHIEPGNEMDLANARLIAAAPDLLEALRDLEIGANTIDGCYTRNPGNFAAALRDLREYAEKARSAIARATGAA